ncbi:TIGR03032 family protein [Roseibium sp. MMSF_3412]|uniref:TIGR03032 family protein n=1 Tax=Roseibium sp. MMSF_3412 TaxID=3046712 RepID=UPI00273F525F|nr:TIGR03032 family protein [Roseibium sp. MMSF_3412]
MTGFRDANSIEAGSQPADDPETAPSSDDGVGGGAPPGAKQEAPEISCSAGLANWLLANACSIVFTSYQTGQVFFVGVMPNGSLSFHQRNFQRAMGLWTDPAAQSLYMSSLFQLWRFENMLRPGEVANANHDKCYIPRQSFVTGDVDAHDIGVDTDGRIIFVNTAYSCLAVPDPVYSFRPLWKPPFITKLVAEDRCHLNGLAMKAGQPRYVTAVCRSDVLNGWRDRRAEGGMIMDVADDTVLTENLSMPHSPRLYQDQLYVLDSGRGNLCRIDRTTGTAEAVAFCPGFLRGLAFQNDHAIVGLSLPRDRSFSGLDLDGTLQEKDADPWCGIQIVDLKSGSIVAWIRLTGGIRELFDVAVLQKTRCPMALGFVGDDIRKTIRFSDDFATFRRPAPDGS